MRTTAIFGRENEIAELSERFSRRRSFLIHGPAGAGKTLLVKQVGPGRRDLLYCPDSSTGQTIFQAIASALFRANDRVMTAACGRAGLEALRKKSAVAMRGIVTNALQGGSYQLVLDHFQSPSRALAGAVKDLLTASGTPLVAVARSPHMEDIGFLRSLFSARGELFAIHDFDPPTAKEFALYRAQLMTLEGSNRDEAIAKIVNYSHGNPGAIVMMLNMAAEPRYVSQSHIKLGPLYVDFKLHWNGIYGH